MSKQKNNFVPPLAVHLIWGSKDYAYYSEGYEDYLDKMSKFVLEFRKYLTRDPDKQFSRTLDIPTFLYCNDKPEHLPKLKKVAEKDIVFFFVTPEMICKEWNEYLGKEIILKSKNQENKNENDVDIDKPKDDSDKNKIEYKYIIPVALNDKSLNFSLYDSMSKRNFVRLNDLKSEEIKLESIIKLLYELYKRVWGIELIRKPTKNNSIEKENNSIEEENNGDKEKNKNYEPIKLFLSHTKKDGSGYAYAKSIIHHIATLNIGRFFDIYDIPPGTNFEEKIEENIQESTFLAIMSDNYSTRYWCQRELMTAKKHNRPIVIANCVEEYEDRSFSAVANLPSIRVPSAKQRKYTKKEKLLQLDILTEELSVKTTHNLLSPNIKYKVKSKDSIKILVAVMVETIRYKYSMDILDFYQKNIKFLEDAEILSRPPESWQIQEAISSRKNIYYPEPPIYHRELMWLLPKTDKISRNTSIKISTPLWHSKYIFQEGEWKEENNIENNQENEKQKNKIGLSIANYLYFSREGHSYIYDNKDMSKIAVLPCENHNQHVDDLTRFSQTLVRYLLAGGYKLIYGGDLRDNGYTEFILNEARITKDRLHKDTSKDTVVGTDNESEGDAYVLNYVAWPYYLEEKTKEWCVNEPGLFEVTKVDPAGNIDREKYPGKEPDDLCKRSVCLTKMRKESIRKSDARIFAGGKIRGYSGKMPGLLEEFIISYDENKPIYLVGGLGGITKLLCYAIKEDEFFDESKDEIREFLDALKENWQKNHNNNLGEHSISYKDLYNKLEESKEKDYKGNSDISYNMLKNILSNPKNLLDELVERSGLTGDKYIRLMKTPFVDEAVHLIIEGLENINRRKDSQHTKSCCGAISDMVRKFCFGADI